MGACVAWDPDGWQVASVASDGSVAALVRAPPPGPPAPLAPCPPQVTERATAGRQEVAAAGCVTLSVALCNTRASPGLQHRLPRVLLGPPAGTHG